MVNDDQMFDADVYVENGIIKEVGKDLKIPDGVRKIDAKGKFVIPGGIDPHTHFQFPFMGTVSADDFFTGTRAALAGGTTTILDFVIPPEGGSILEAYEQWRSWADEKVCCDYGLHVAVTSWSDKVAREMEILCNERGVNSYKMFMVYTFRVNDAQMLQIFEKCRELGAIGMVHAENGDVIDMNRDKLLKSGVTGPEGHLYSRPEEIEAEATNRACVLANEVNCPLYVVHVMSKMSSDVISRWRRQGSIVFGETLGAAVGSDGTNYFNKCWRHAAGHVMSPPIRCDPNTPDHLLDMLTSGMLDTTGSDHCVFSGSQKALGKEDFTKIPSGVNGVEERMMLFWDKGVVQGKMDPCKFVAITSTNTAKLFNFYPRKGRIAVGSDADIVVWDPERVKTISVKTQQSAVDFNIFEGTVCRGAPLYVISNGRVVVEEGELRVVKGMGRFIPTPTFAESVYYTVKEREKVKVPQKIPREPYTGPVAVTHNGSNGTPTTPVVENLIIPTEARDYSSEPIGDVKKNTRPTIKVHNPPGGRSSGALW